LHQIVDLSFYELIDQYLSGTDCVSRVEYYWNNDFHFQDFQMTSMDFKGGYLNSGKRE